MATNGKPRLPDRCSTCGRRYTLPDHVEQVLKEAGAAMSLGDIITNLKRRGKVFPSDAASWGTVGNALYRNRTRFRQVTRKGKEIRGLYELCI